MKATLARQTVGVMGSGSDEHDEAARGVGELLAALGVNLLTGGGRGVMRSVSRAYTQTPRASGICIGIIPCRSVGERRTPKEGYPNEFVELPIYTHLPFSGRQGTHDLSRNHINVLTCAAIIALPGGEGTATEVALALDYEKPVIAYATDLTLVQSFLANVRRATTLEAVRQFLLEHLRIS
ncbi:MAG TPA: hypothetical protein VGV59_19610 [Pyrinomonadaceae bacterium]|nr:hypothetical protein [Pyrinomonadaceae bacterium]